VNHLIKRNLAITVGVEIFHQSFELIFSHFDSVGFQTEFEFYWVDKSVTILVQLLELHFEPSESICCTFELASLNHSFGDVAEIGHATGSFDVWIAHVEICTLSLSKINLASLLFEVDVSVEA
jgi:hypothetical protein